MDREAKNLVERQFVTEPPVSSLEQSKISAEFLLRVWDPIIKDDVLLNRIAGYPANKLTVELPRDMVTPPLLGIYSKVFDEYLPERSKVGSGQIIHYNDPGNPGSYQSAAAVFYFDPQDYRLMARGLVEGMVSWREAERKDLFGLGKEKFINWMKQPETQKGLKSLLEHAGFTHAELKGFVSAAAHADNFEFAIVANAHMQKVLEEYIAAPNRGGVAPPRR